MAFVQCTVGVMQSMQMFDQQVLRVPIQRGFAQNGSHHHQGLDIGNTAFDLLARTAGAVAQMLWGAELNGFHTGSDANPIHTPKPGAFPLAMMAQHTHTGPWA